MFDYLVVGCGLAGIAVCEELEQRRRSFRVYADYTQNSSIVAGGIYNPLILKRFSLAWQADRQMEHSLPMYEKLESKLGRILDHRLPIQRIFSDGSEQNRWFEAMDDPRKGRFMNSRLERIDHPGVRNPFGVGRMEGTGWIDTRTLVSIYADWLESRGVLFRESLEYGGLHIGRDAVEYQGERYGEVIFCEGFGLKKNPFFDYLPLVGTKGELLLVRIEGFEGDSILKSSVFSVPLGGGLHRLGATYKWQDKTAAPTPESRAEIEEKARRFLEFSWTVEGHTAGIRPTVTDRRPLVGSHPVHKRLHVLNGLGSRGVLLAPYLSGPLIDSIESGQALDPEVDIRRFSPNNSRT